MIKIMTKLQVEELQQHSRLERLRELDKRSLLDASLKSELYRLERGEIGENYVMECLEEFGKDGWQV